MGPNFGFLLGGKAEFERTTTVSFGSVSNPLKPVNIDDIDWKDYDSFKGIFASNNVHEEDGDFLNAVDLGINVGAIFYVTDNLFLDLRVSQGLTDVTNNHYDSSIYPEADYSFENREDTDRNFSIQLGVPILNRN